MNKELEILEAWKRIKNHCQNDFIMNLLYGYEKELRIVKTALNEFVKLKKIEKELGVGLTTLFKALKQETLFIKTDFDIRETIKNGEGWGMKHLSFEDGELVIFCQMLYPNDITHKEWVTPLRLKLCDYGKTWALTKEELL